MKQDDFVIGDDVENITFEDEVDDRGILRIASLSDPDDGGWSRWWVNKAQTIQLRDWLNKLIEKENW